MRENCVTFLRRTVPDSIGTAFPFLLEGRWGHNYDSVAARIDAMRSNSEFAGYLECLAIAFLHDKPINVWVKRDKTEGDLVPECSLRQIIPCRKVLLNAGGSSCTEQSLSMQSFNLLYKIDSAESGGHFDALWNENSRNSFLSLREEFNSWNEFPSQNSQINCDTFIDLVNPELWTLTEAIVPVSINANTEALQDSATQSDENMNVLCLWDHTSGTQRSLAVVPAAETTKIDTENMDILDDNSEIVDEITCIWNTPRQPMMNAYPADDDNRRFRKCWFEMFPWLEFDEAANCKAGAAFCFYCRQAKIRKLIESSKCEKTFTLVGFRKWKNAVHMFKKHQMTASHKTAVVAVAGVLSDTNVCAKLSVQVEVTRKENTKMLTCIFTTLKFLCRQGLAIRGEKDDRSNFYQLLLTRTSDVAGLTNWLSKTTNWTSHAIQDEIIELMAISILRKIAAVISSQGLYGLLADETQDMSLLEQLVVCIRTISNSLDVEEYVLGLHSLERCDAATIHAVISDILCRFNINIQECRAVCFDGASAFQGQHAGVAVKMQAKQPKIIVTHCHMHCVNLAVQETVSSVSIMRNFLQLVMDLINFFRESPKRCAIVRNVAESLKCSQSHIRPLCPTRFTVKYRAIESISKQLSVLQTALMTINNEYTENKLRAHACGFMKRLSEFEFFFCLQVSLLLFELTDRLSTQLQSPRLSAGESVNLVKFCIDEIEKHRCDNGFDKIWQKANSASADMDADAPCLPRQTGVSKRLQQSNVYKFSTAKEWYRSIYFEVLDYALEGLRRRVVEQNVKVLLATESLLLSGWFGSELNKEDMHKVTEHFATDIDCFRLEQQLCSLENIRKSFPEAEQNVPLSKVIANIGSSKLAVWFCFIFIRSFLTPDIVKFHLAYDFIYSDVLQCIKNI